ncbi:MAG: hypothetical protein V9E81_02770 [Marmoricola sp.]
MVAAYLGTSTEEAEEVIAEGPLVDGIDLSKPVLDNTSVEDLIEDEMGGKA